MWHAWHARRDSLPGEIFFGQAAPAAVTRQAWESLAGEPTQSADERLGPPKVQPASPQPAQRVPGLPGWARSAIHRAFSARGKAGQSADNSAEPGNPGNS